MTVQQKQSTEAVLQSITAPEPLKGVPSGTGLETIGKKLPVSVKITTSKGEKIAAVTWKLAEVSYNAASLDAQKFDITGTVTLPEGVVNTDNIPLQTAISIEVKAYEPKVASADKNKILGLADGPYTTSSRINFKAVGAGMDNEAPKKGDTRYIPESWSVVNSYKWEKAPFTASFGMAKPGNYTLSVVFKQQKYDGNAWADTGSKDTKSIAFSISASGTPTATPDPSVSPAVNTGDDNPIGMLVGLLGGAGAAIAALAGLLIYRRKKK
ncbi:MAG: LPXTG cell wall anchor domain-containing protein [Clostridiales bacterium]|nr:LPXTG cell wall anchor domain-containing protein [Candidatus Blautia equi]